MKVVVVDKTNNLQRYLLKSSGKAGGVYLSNCVNVAVGVWLVLWLVLWLVPVADHAADVLAAFPHMTRLSLTLSQILLLSSSSSRPQPSQDSTLFTRVRWHTAYLMELRD